VLSDDVDELVSDEFLTFTGVVVVVVVVVVERSV